MTSTTAAKTTSKFTSSATATKAATIKHKPIQSSTNKSKKSFNSISIDNNVSPIPMYYQNIRSIPAKENLYQNLQTTIYDVIFLSETWLTDKHKTETYVPSRFNVHRLDRNVNNSDFNRAGGVAILVDSKYQSKRLKQYENSDVEGMCVEIQFNQKTLITYLAYVPELIDARDEVFRKHTACIEQIVSNTTNDVIVMGDFNIRGVKWQSSIDSKQLVPINVPVNDKFGFNEFLNNMQYLSLVQLNHISNDAGNYLDLMFTQNECLFSINHAPATLTNIKQTDSPHPPLEIAVNVSLTAQQTDEFIEIYAYSKGNYQNIINDLNRINFAEVFHGMSTDDAFDYFYSILNDTINKNVPLVKIKCNKNKPKWWNTELQKLKNKRNKEWKRSNGDSSNVQYKKALNDFNDRNEEIYTNYINEIQSQFKSNPSMFWKFARERTKSAAYPSVMSYNDKTADTSQNIANLFADNFKTYYSADDKNIDLVRILSRCSDDANEIQISMFDIENTINDKIKFNGAVGADGISPKFIHMCKDSLIWPLWILYQKT